jgi:hypothetical protein
MPRCSRRIAVLAAVAATALMVAAGVAVAAASLAPDLLRSGEQPGYHVTGHVTVERTVAAVLRQLGATGKQAQADAKQLRAVGFAGAAFERLTGSGGKAFSEVIAFTNHRGASETAASRASTVYLGQKARGATVSRFRIPGVRSARGVTVTRGKKAGSVVYWTAGDCSLGSGVDFLSSGTVGKAAVDAAAVIAGVKSQHARIGGHCP